MSREQRLQQTIAAKQAQWRLQHDKLSKLKQEAALETRADEKLRLRYRIEEVEQDKAQLEHELDELEAQLARSLPAETNDGSPKKREQGSSNMTNQAFDVFLSHNSNDKPAVRELKQQLEGYNLTVWLDEDELRPGIPWQNLLELGIKTSASVVVLVGADGLGPWEDEEMQAALRLAGNDKRPVIPVLLPDAPTKPKLPMFLSNRTWVDLRGGATKEKLDKLVWGITGTKPNP